jgi:hypothetical protein
MYLKAEQSSTKAQFPNQGIQEIDSISNNTTTIPDTKTKRETKSLLGINISISLWGETKEELTQGLLLD